VKCKLCGVENDTVRITVLDDYDQVRFTYRSIEEAKQRQDAEFAMIDRGADLYRIVACGPCRNEVAANG